MLHDKGWDYEEIVIGKDITTRSIKACTGRTSTPRSLSMVNTLAVRMN
jgi:hypothetical protein